VADVPLRYIVELRPPRKGERYVQQGYRVLGTCLVDDCPWPLWVIVDPVPADPTPTEAALPADSPVALSERWEAVAETLKRQNEARGGIVRYSGLSGREDGPELVIHERANWRAPRGVPYKTYFGVPLPDPILEALLDEEERIARQQHRGGVEGTETTKEPK
jgi:hypothetical protein